MATLFGGVTGPQLDYLRLRTGIRPSSCIAHLCCCTLLLANAKQQNSPRADALGELAPSVSRCMGSCYIPSHLETCQYCGPKLLSRGSQKSGYTSDERVCMGHMQKRHGPSFCVVLWANLVLDFRTVQVDRRWHRNVTRCPAPAPLEAVRSAAYTTADSRQEHVVADTASASVQPLRGERKGSVGYRAVVLLQSVMPWREPWCRLPGSYPRQL